MPIDFDTAAIKASETLIKHRITSAPVIPMPIIKSTPGVLVLSFADLANRIGTDRENVISTFQDNQDAVTTVLPDDRKLRYIVAYNQKLPFYLLQRALARELGHIVLRHDGTRPEEVRTEEALIFARHLLCHRAVLKAIEAEGIPLTVDLIGSISGCYKKCIEGMQRTPGASVPPELNRLIKEQFADYVHNFCNYARTVMKDDHSGLADFGSYFDNYEE